MLIPKVENMTSPRTGQPVANQYIISINGVGTIFQSYRTIIAVKTPKGIILDRDAWNYSRTTSKYRNEFLGENTAETRRKIDNGEYEMEDLNA